MESKENSMPLNTCRFCQHDLNKTFINLGKFPLSNSYLTKVALNQTETFYPLHVKICENCFLVQLPEFESPKKIFTHYFYFSSYSDSWLKHAKAYTDMMIERFSINDTWHVVEIASNDGYLLQYFKEKNISVLGVEPSINVAEISNKKGIPTRPVFFGSLEAKKMLQEGKQANLLIGNNVLAHVPNLNDFVAGMKILLAHDGVLTLEFPHLLRLMDQNQFDTIYHEHFSYFLFSTAKKLFSKHQLTIFDVEELPVHGGSLRIFVKHAEDDTKIVSSRVDSLIQKEKTLKLDKIESYENFADKVTKLKKELLDFMLKAKQNGKKIVGYGAPAKANTLLNYCGIDTTLLPLTVDINPFKQNHYLPGTHIPIFHPDKIQEIKPDFLLLLPWNLKNEIMEQMSYIRDWQGKFVVPIPSLEII